MGSAPKIRRWLAGICLAAALLMLVLGLTAFGGWLQKSYPFLLYWAICGCLTGLAAVTALIDLFLLRRQLRRDQENLIEQTLRKAKGERDQPPPS